MATRPAGRPKDRPIKIGKFTTTTEREKAINKRRREVMQQFKSQKAKPKAPAAQTLPIMKGKKKPLPKRGSQPR